MSKPWAGCPSFSRQRQTSDGHDSGVPDRQEGHQRLLRAKGNILSSEESQNDGVTALDIPAGSLQRAVQS
eukprot:scaffold412964_cov18-Prasinocladus_malaysianus.AAC.1